MNIAIVEDQANVAKLAALLFEQLLSGHGENQVFVADTFKGLLDLLDKERIDITLLDLNLTDSHGKTTLNRIDEVSSRTKIVVFTGASDPDIDRVAREKGAAGIIYKEAELFKEVALVRKLIEACKKWGKENTTDANLLLLEQIVDLQYCKSHPPKPNALTVDNPS